MKKKEKEKRYGLLKGVLILVVIAFILSWIIPTGGYTSTGFTEVGMTRLGLYDIAYTVYYALSFAVDKLVILFVIGAFYGIITRTQGYERIVSGIARKLNKKFAVVLFSVILAVLTSLLTQTFAVLIFVPFIISILNRMKLDKMTILATTFGSILVGIMGATYGTDGISMFNYYLGYTAEIPNEMPALLVRGGILLIGLVLFNFFTLTHMSKVSDKAESIDLFEVEVPEERVKKTKSVIPLIVIGILLLALVILGFMSWQGNFGIEVFNNFHTFVTEKIKIGSGDNSFFIFQDLLGTGISALGSWNNITISAILIVFGLILALCYRFKLNELFDAVRLAAYNKIPKKFKREETYVKAGFAKRNNRDGFLFEYIIDHGLIKEPQVIIEDTHTDFNNVRSNFNNGTEIAIRDLSVIKAKKLLILGKDHVIKESDE